MRDDILYVSLGGFAAGVLIRSFFDFGLAFPLFFLLIAFAVFLIAKKQFLIAVFMVAVSFGIFRYDIEDINKGKNFFDDKAGNAVSLTGVVVSEPDIREKTARLVVEMEGSRLLIITGVEPKYEYGDFISFSGKLERAEDFIDEITLRRIDYRKYLEKDGIYYEIFMPEIKILSRNEGNFIVENLLAFKHLFIQKINYLIPEPHSALLAGLIVGAKKSLGKELLDDFRKTGVIHIVVLSGYNITVIACFIEWLLSSLRKETRLFLASIAMILFAIMVGAGATVVRATIMALFAVVARATGRIYSVTRALLIAGFLMLLQNPKILVFDASFQLSFLATVGLICFSPFIEKRARWITDKWRFREIFVATVSTQLFVLPFLLYKTGMLSLVSLPVNLLILAVIPATMFLGFITGVLSLFSVLVAVPFSYATYALLAYELVVVEFFARLPFSALKIASFPFVAMLACYAFYAVFIIKMRMADCVQCSPSLS